VKGRKRDKGENMSMFHGRGPKGAVIREEKQ